jgi:hypothetical protein
MARRNEPAATPAPTAAPARAEVTEVLDAKAGTPPAKLSKLSLAMQVVQANITTIESFDAQVHELVRTNPTDRKYDLTTKEGKKEADDARKEARKHRLAINNMVKDGKSVLNQLKDELVAAAELHVPTLDAIETNAKTQIDAAAQAEEDRKQRHREAINAIARMAEGCATMTSEQAQAALDGVTAIIVDDSYEEFADEAAKKRHEVMGVLREAVEAAKAREQQEVERKAREAARVTAQAAIDAMKALPDSVDGTEAASIRVVLDAHNRALPTAEVYGDLLEMAELWHFRIAKQLEELWTQTGLAEEKAKEEALIEQRGKETGLGGAQWTEVEMDTIRAKGAEPLALNTIGAAEIPEEFAAGGAGADDGPDDDADGLAIYADTMEPLDPVPAAGNKPLDDARESRPPIRTAPMPRPTFRATPAATPAPAPLEPSGDEVPDLLKAAQDFITTVEESLVGGFGAVEDMPASWRAAYDALKAAVDLTSEFAD